MGLNQLKKVMLEHGYPVENLKFDGEYQRFAIQGHKDQPGFYLIRQSASGLSAVYGDFISGQKHRWTSGNNSKPSTPEEAEEIKKQLTKEAKEIEAKIKRKHEKGAMAAEFFWNTGETFKSHDYLESKKVKNHGLKRCTLGDYAGWLMVPAYNDAGELCTVQYIDRDGAKRFETGGQKKGAFFEITGNKDKIIIAEGYSTAASIHDATGHTAIVAFDAGNLSHVAKSIRTKYHDADIFIAADNDQWKPDIGNVGVDSAKNAAIEIDVKIAIPKFKNTETEPTDFNDLANLEGLEAVRAQIQAAAPINKTEALKVEIEKILDLDPLAQDFERTRLSKQYGVNKSSIDKYIAQHSKNESSSNAVVDDVEPASDPVDGEKLLDLILSELNRRVVLPEGAAETVSLWTVLTYCFNLFDTLPMLLVTSPTHRCGKTTLIEVIEAFSYKAISSSNISSAAVYRLIEQYRPTLLIDEADTFINNRNNPDLAGVINSGHTKSSAKVIRCEGDKNEIKVFSTWAPKLIGMIGMPRVKTISDRSFVIQLKRKSRGEKTDNKTKGILDRCRPVRSMLLRWANDNAERISSCCESLPPSDNDRADDNWATLFTIASVIGGSWPEKVKNARNLIDDSLEDDAIGTQLLTDIRDIFDEQSAEKVFSNDLIEKLNAISDSPWGDWNKGRGLTTNGLARLLKPFGVTSKTMRIDGPLAKGYNLKSFQDAFTRYIPPIQNVTPLQTNEFDNLGEKQNVTLNPDVTDENFDNQLNLFNCYDVTDEIGATQGDKEIDVEKTKKWEIGTI